MHACMLHAQLFSHVWLFVTLWTVPHQAPLSMGFSRQEYWSGLPFPFPGDLPNPGIKPMSPASPALAGKLFTSEPAESPQGKYGSYLKVQGKRVVSCSKKQEEEMIFVTITVSQGHRTQVKWNFANKYLHLLKQNISSSLPPFLISIPLCSYLHFLFMF